MMINFAIKQQIQIKYPQDIIAFPHRCSSLQVYHSDSSYVEFGTGFFQITQNQLFFSIFLIRDAFNCFYSFLNSLTLFIIFLNMENLIHIEIQTQSPSPSSNILKQQPNFINKPPLPSKSIKQSPQPKTPIDYTPVQKYKLLLKQLAELAAKVDKVAQDYHIKISKSDKTEKEDPRILTIQKQLMQQQKKKKVLKKKCATKQNKMVANYNETQFILNNNQLKFYQQMLKEAEQERKDLEKILQMQKKAINESVDKMSMKKINRVEEQLRVQMQKNKGQTSRINELNKKVMNLQTAFYEKSKYLGEIEQLIVKGDQKGNISREDIEKLEKQLKEIEQQKQKFEIIYQKKLHKLKKEKQVLQNQLNEKEQLIEQKKKEEKFAQNKLKFIKRLITPYLQRINQSMYVKNQPKQVRVKTEIGNIQHRRYSNSDKQNRNYGGEGSTTFITKRDQYDDELIIDD